MSSRLVDLHRLCDQSPWLDNLQRCDLRNGRLASLVREGIRGVTSNPTIFQKAIQGSHDYDEQLFGLLDSGASTREAYWELVVSDIRDALEVLAPVHRESGGADGFVSLEVDPSLAHDTAATIDAALGLWNRIDRANLMVKVPATVAGVPAIRELVAAGLNVNVTLIFSIDRYRDVVGAYIDGLSARLAKGLPVSDIAGVASFFISRVDTEVDARLAEKGHQELMGRAAIAQARLVYEEFLGAFSADARTGWAELAAAGARPQRPLWASTSTKNPSYPDTMYVDQLIGPRTVNTLPEATMEAFMDHGTVVSVLGSADSTHRADWTRISEAGIDMDQVADKLEREGVAAFIDSFEGLIATLDQRAATRN